MANLATATAADRITNAVLTATVADLIAQLVEANKQLTKVNAQLVKAKGSAQRSSGCGGGCGGSDNAADTATTAFQARIGGPTGRHYCWSCGDYCYHSSPRRRSKKTGHKVDATREDKMGGSSYSFA